MLAHLQLMSVLSELYLQIIRVENRLVCRSRADCLQVATLTLAATVEKWRSLLSIQFPPELRQQIEEGLGLEKGQISIMQEVNSSNIAAIGHDGILTLQVNFIEGASYQYFEVPYRVFEAFLAAHSKGDFLYYNIKSRYRYERITD